MSRARNRFNQEAEAKMFEGVFFNQVAEAKRFEGV